MEEQKINRKENIFGVNLKTLRKENHMSQKSLAENLKMHRNTVSGYENGTVTPSVEALLEIAAIFQTSVDYLLGINSESVLYLDHFSEVQRNIITHFIHDLQEHF